MKKSHQIFFVAFLWILIITHQTNASEKLLFLDYTQNESILSLKEFFAHEANLIVVVPPEPLPPQEEITKPVSLEKLASLANLFFVAYEKDSLLFVELIDLHFRQEILSMVRKKEEGKTMEATLKEKMRKILALEPEIKIIFPRETNGQFLLLAIDPQGKREVLLTSFLFGPAEGLTMSPDGQFLAFVANQGHKKAIYLFAMQERAFQCLSPWEWSDASPSFSERDRKIVFVSERNTKRGFFTMNLDGSNQRLLFEKENPVDAPSFSRDGQRFIYCELTGGKWQLKIKNLLSQTEETLDFPGNVFQPTFMFNGQNIVFVGEINGMYDLYLYSVFERNITRLTVDNFPKAHPAPSPDGRWITFRGQKEGNNWDIFVLDLYKRNLIYRLTSSLAQEGDPVFTPYPIY
ncbi:MAG: hypothetical protein ABDK94_00055 [Atribacterota bacterium]